MPLRRRGRGAHDDCIAHASSYQGAVFMPTARVGTEDLDLLIAGAGARKIFGCPRDTAAQHGIDRNVRSQHRVGDARWSSGAARWTIEVERAGKDEPVTLTASWLLCATGADLITDPADGLDAGRARR